MLYGSELARVGWVRQLFKEITRDDAKYVKI